MSSNENSSGAESSPKDPSKNKIVPKKGTIMKSNYYAVKLGKNNKLYISLNSKNLKDQEEESDINEDPTGTESDISACEEESEEIGTKEIDSQTADSDVLEFSRSESMQQNSVQNDVASTGINGDISNNSDNKSINAANQDQQKFPKKRSKSGKNTERSLIKKRKVTSILDSAEESLNSMTSTPIVTGYSLEHNPPQSSYSLTPARRTSKRSAILDSEQIEETSRKNELKREYESNLKTNQSNYTNDPTNEYSTANKQSKNSDLRNGFNPNELVEKKGSENFKYNKIKLKLTNMNSDLLDLLDNSDKKPKSKKRGKPRNSKKSTDLPTSESVEPIDHNEDFCSACGGIGNFLCCEGCPKSFHLECLNPPLEEDELPEGDWFCNHCIIRRLKEQHIKLPTVNGIFGKLIINMKKKNPRKFDLPNGIWERFNGVSKGRFGEFTVEKDYYKEIVGKKGLQQAQTVHIYDSHVDDDPSDNNNTTITSAATSEHSNHKDSLEILKSESLPKPLFCYKCGKSGLHANKNLIKCEYCPLVWHLDCLDPPLPSIKILGRKWRCPNHVDDLIDNSAGYITGIPKFTNGGLKVKDRTNLNVCISRKFSNNGYNLEIVSDINKPGSNHSEKKDDGSASPIKNTEILDNVSQFNHDFRTMNFSKKKIDHFEKTFDTSDGVGAVIRTKYWKNYTLTPKYGNFGKGEKQIFEDDNNDSIVYRYPESSVILDFVDNVKSKRQEEINSYNSRTMSIFNQIVNSINNSGDHTSEKKLDLLQIEAARNLLELQSRSKERPDTATVRSNNDDILNSTDEQKIRLFIEDFGKEKFQKFLKRIT